MVTGLEWVVALALVVGLSIAGYAQYAWQRRCLRELNAIKWELAQIRAQLGAPKEGVYRLVATRAAAPPVEEELSRRKSSPWNRPVATESREEHVG